MTESICQGCREESCHGCNNHYEDIWKEYKTFDDCWKLYERMNVSKKNIKPKRRSKIQMLKDDYYAIKSKLERCEKELERFKEEQKMATEANVKLSGENVKLKRIIDSLKNCRNCEHECDYEESDSCMGCRNKSKWEMMK